MNKSLIILTISYFLINFNLFSQSNIDKESKIGIFSFYLANEITGLRDNNNLNTFNKKKIYGLSTGINVNFHRNKRIVFQSGLSFQKKGNSYEFFAHTVMGDSVTGSFKAKSKYNIYFLSIPINCKLYLRSKSINYFMQFGFTNDLALFSTNKIKQYSVPDNQFITSFTSKEKYLKRNFNEIYSIGSGISIGLEKRFNQRKISIAIEYRQLYLLTFDKSDLNYYSWGIKLETDF